MLRVVIDTNIFISACWSPGKLEDQVIERGLGRHFQWFLSPELRDEYVGVPQRPKFAKVRATMEARLALLLQVVQPVVGTGIVAVSADPKDNMVLACAEAAAADYLVTGNTAAGHFPAIYGCTQIVTSRQFLAANHWLLPGA